MRRFGWYLFALGTVLLAMGACSVLPRPLGPLAKGEVRLRSMRLPDIMTAGVSYDVAVNFEGEDPSAIKRVVFHWVSENTPISAQQSLYCYSYEVQSNQPIGAVCPRWIAEGPYTSISPSFYVKGDDLTFAGSSRFTAKLPAEAVKSEYNRLVGYVEYMKNGSLVESNKVSAKTMIER